MVRCLIAEDESPARKLIAMHLSGLEGFEVSCSVDNGLAALAYLQQHLVDLVFLDINMPGLSGMELLQSLQNRPAIILTTAYREHAAQAYDLDVLDYLLKPITKDRFMKAIAKFMHYKHAKPNYVLTDASNYHFFKTGREQVKIYLREIVFIEGLSDYAKVHTVNQSYVVSEKLAHLEQTLPGELFVRIHKSFIIAFAKISSYNNVQVNLSGKVLPLGRLYKNGFLKSGKLNP